MTVPSSKYASLLKASHIDVDSKGNLKASNSQNIMFGKYSYQPHEYAKKALTVIQQKINDNDTTANEKKDLKKLADKVWADYNKLQAANRQKWPKRVGVIASFVISGTKLIHKSPRQPTNNVESMRLLHASITGKKAPTLQMGVTDKNAQEVDKAMQAHRVPGHDKRGEITAAQLIDQFKDVSQNASLCFYTIQAGIQDFKKPGTAEELIDQIKDPVLKEQANAKLNELARNALSRTYNGKNNITACQNQLLPTFLDTPPKDWEAYKQMAPAEKVRVEAFLLDLEFKLELEKISKTKISELSQNVQDTLGTVDDTSITLEQFLKSKPPQERQRILDSLNLVIVTKSLDELLKKPVGPKLKGRTPGDSITVLTNAHIKEIAAREAYRTEMPKKIAAGFYNPAVIPNEIRKELGVSSSDPLPPTIITTAKVSQENVQVVKDELRNELERIKGHLTHDQLRYIRNDINELMDMYVAAYPGEKTMEQAYILGRDALRAIVYQEIHDKGSFTGSDHGSKHVHHNCQGADGLHHGMEKGDFNAKDQFMEHLIHMYHDMGYTVGLAATNFDCCKDHPFIGAAMIAANKDYFTDLLDAHAYEALHDSILCHAIAIPDLQPDSDAVVQRTGFHPSLVRSVTSISDACAVTYDRKTQEFWEQPEAIVALSRLKIFVAQYPQYMDVLSNPDILEDGWKGLDRGNPLDRIAHDVFETTKAELLALADTYTLAPNMEDRRDLFKQAIRSQFNAFTAKVTLGQYGAVLHGITSVKNVDGSVIESPYLVELDISPSIAYGVLKDLFGEDQAAASFIKLLEEFGGRYSDIQQGVNAAGDANKNRKKIPPMSTRSGVARFKITPDLSESRSVAEPDKAAQKHKKRLQKNTVKAAKTIAEVQRSATLDFEQKRKVLTDLEALRKPDSTKTLSICLNELVIKSLPGAFSKRQETEIKALITATAVTTAFGRCKEFEKEHITRVNALKIKLNKQGLDESAQNKFFAELEKKRSGGFSNITDALNMLPKEKKDAAKAAFEEIFTEKIKADYKVNEKQFNDIRNMFLLACMSDKEYAFMVGKKAEKTRTQLLIDVQNQLNPASTV